MPAECVARHRWIVKVNHHCVHASLHPASVPAHAGHMPCRGMQLMVVSPRAIGLRSQPEVAW